MAAHAQTARSDRWHPVFRVQRIGAAVVALVLLAFGILGFLGHPGFLSRHGTNVAGLTSNGLLATISLVVGVLLVVAAVLSGPIASTTCTILGGLFVLSGLLGLIALRNPQLNILAFTLPDIVFSLVVGLLLLYVGLFGRASGQLPADSPYRARGSRGNPLSRLWHDEDLAQPPVDDPAGSQQEIAENERMAEAEHAVAEGTATPEQDRQVMADAAQRAAERRQAAWRRAEEQENGRP